MGSWLSARRAADSIRPALKRPVVEYRRSHNPSWEFCDRRHCLDGLFEIETRQWDPGCRRVVPRKTRSDRRSKETSCQYRRSHNPNREFCDRRHCLDGLFEIEIAAMGSWLSTRRAAGLDPTVALRDQLSSTEDRIIQTGSSATGALSRRPLRDRDRGYGILAVGASCRGTRSDRRSKRPVVSTKIT